VVAVCDEGNQACPALPIAKRRLHWSLKDPSRVKGDKEQRLEVFRSVRDENLKRIEGELIVPEERATSPGAVMLISVRGRGKQRRGASWTAKRRPS
jgi:hypothetical protein